MNEPTLVKDRPDDEDGEKVIIPHDDPEHTPWRVEAVQPKGFRDAWRVLTGRYRPRVTLTRSLTLTGADRVLKAVYGPDISQKLRAPSPLQSLLEYDRETRSASRQTSS